MAEVELVVRNPSGLHARPLNLFVTTAAGFASRITVENLDRGSRAVDAKSLLHVLTIGAVRGHRVRVVADGPDAEAAVEKLRALVESGLGEPLGG